MGAYIFGDQRPHKIKASHLHANVDRNCERLIRGGDLSPARYGLLHLRDQLQLADHAGDDRKLEVRRFFLRHAHQRVLLKDFARALSLSPSRASHLVNELFGVSFQEMLLQERIARAKVLLMSSTYSMNEIAKRIGIDNEYYFSRLFRKKVGMPPGRFRKENQKPITEGDE